MEKVDVHIEHGLSVKLKTLRRGGFPGALQWTGIDTGLWGLFRQFLGISHLRIKETFFAGSAIVTSNPLSGNPVTVSYPLALTVTLAFRPPSRLRVLPRRHCTSIIPLHVDGFAFYAAEGVQECFGYRRMRMNREPYAFSSGLLQRKPGKRAKPRS
jgi:hypothetical protein